VLLAGSPPVPGQQLGDAGEHVGKPGARIDVVELGRLDEPVDDGGAPAARVRAAEGEILLAEEKVFATGTLAVEQRLGSRSINRSTRLGIFGLAICSSPICGSHTNGLREINQ
jgi:hypothetical protein